MAELVDRNISEDWASKVKNNCVCFLNPRDNIDNPPENIMNTEAACKIWLKGDCWKNRKEYVTYLMHVRI